MGGFVSSSVNQITDSVRTTSDVAQEIIEGSLEDAEGRISQLLQETNVTLEARLKQVSRLADDSITGLEKSVELQVNKLVALSNSFSVWSLFCGPCRRRQAARITDSIRRIERPMLLFGFAAPMEVSRTDRFIELPGMFLQKGAPVVRAAVTVEREDATDKRTAGNAHAQVLYENLDMIRHDGRCRIHLPDLSNALRIAIVVRWNYEHVPGLCDRVTLDVRPPATTLKSLLAVKQERDQKMVVNRGLAMVRVEQVSVRTGSIRAIWSDQGSYAPTDVHIFRVLPFSADYRPLSDVAHTSSNWTGPVAFVPANAAGYFPKPKHYRRVWTDRDTGCDSDVAFWSPVPPTDDFVACGLVVSFRYDEPPSVDLVRCVHRSLVFRSEKDLEKIWDYPYKPCSIWRQRPHGGMVLQATTKRACAVPCYEFKSLSSPLRQRTSPQRPGIEVKGERRYPVVTDIEESSADDDDNIIVSEPEVVVVERKRHTATPTTTNATSTPTASTISSAKSPISQRDEGKKAKKPIDLAAARRGVHMVTVHTNSSQPRSNGCHLRLIWTDAGSGNSEASFAGVRLSGDVRIFRPECPGMCAVGDVVSDQKSAKLRVYMVPDNDFLRFPRPIAYKQLITDAGTGCDVDMALWQPVAPDGFVSVGVVCVTGKHGLEPDKNVVRCVPKGIVGASPAGIAPIWNYDDGDTRILLWRNEFLGCVLTNPSSRRKRMQYLGKCYQFRSEQQLISSATPASPPPSDRKEHSLASIRESVLITTVATRARKNSASHLRLLWQDSGSGNKKSRFAGISLSGNVRVYRAARPGYRPVGDCVTDLADDQLRVCFVPKNDMDNFPAPLSFRKLVTDEGTNCDASMELWFPEAPQGFVALGCVLGGRDVAPDIDCVRCVPAWMVHIRHAGLRPVWHFRSSQYPMVLWRNTHIGTLITNPHSFRSLLSYRGELYALKSSDELDE